MRTLCGHISLEIYVRTMSAQHLTKDICLTREMLCGHSADTVRTLCGHISPGIYAAQYPHYILLRFSAQGGGNVYLRNLLKFVLDRLDALEGDSGDSRDSGEPREPTLHLDNTSTTQMHNRNVYFLLVCYIVSFCFQ